MNSVSANFVHLIAGADDGASIHFEVRAIQVLINRIIDFEPGKPVIVVGTGKIRLDSISRANQLPPLEDAAVAARFVIEAVATWAVHIHWDPSPQPIDPGVAERMVVDLVVEALTRPPT